MDYNDIIAPWQNLPPYVSALKYYTLDGIAPKLIDVADAALAHDTWFKAHTEWLIGERTVKGARLRTFFYGIEAVVTDPDMMPVTPYVGPPVLWNTDVLFPGDYGARRITGCVSLLDARIAHAVALTLLEENPPIPVDDAQKQAAFWQLVEAINDDFDRRHLNGKYSPPKAPPIIVPPGTPVIDVGATPPAKEGE